MHKAITFNVLNSFYNDKFQDLCMLLENGETVEVFVDCDGHTRNNYTQEMYKDALLKKYGKEHLHIECVNGACCYSYIYHL